MRTLTASMTLFAMFLTLGCHKPQNPVDAESPLTLKQVLFFSSNRDGRAQNIFMMNLDGTGVVQLTHYASGYFRGPRISPDGKRLLYYRFDDRTLTLGIYLKDLYGPDPTTPLDFGYDCNFSPDGNTIVYATSGITIMRLKDSAWADLTPGSDWNPSFSPDGKSIVFLSWRPIDSSDTMPMSHWDLMIMNSDGSNQRPLIPPQMRTWFGGPSFSNDGQKVVFIHHTDNYWISILSLSDGNWFHLAQSPSTNTDNPLFSLQDDKIYFQSGYQNACELYSIPSTGGPITRLTNNQFDDSDPAVFYAWLH